MIILGFFLNSEDNTVVIASVAAVASVAGLGLTAFLATVAAKKL